MLKCACRPAGGTVSESGRCSSTLEISSVTSQDKGCFSGSGGQCSQNTDAIPAFSPTCISSSSRSACSLRIMLVLALGGITVEAIPTIPAHFSVAFSVCLLFGSFLVLFSCSKEATVLTFLSVLNVMSFCLFHCTCLNRLLDLDDI